jgi:parallel beta-helix repeat protein
LARRYSGMMMRTSLAMVLVTVTLASAAWAVESLTQGELALTISVQPGESIQTAIERAPEGAVIILAEGEWRENVVIEKSLTLRGQGAERSVIRVRDADSHVVQIKAAAGLDALEHAPHVVLEDLSVTGAYGLMLGILVGIGAEATITSCIVAECGSGICIEDSARVTISGCTVSNNRRDAAPEYFGDGEGIGLWGDSQATIQGCVVSRNAGDGIKVWDSAIVVITDCTVSRNRFGIDLRGSVQATIERNRISENRHYGVFLREWPCLSTEEVFAGYVMGRANSIPGPYEPGGNAWDTSTDPPCEGSVCPADLTFLTTEAGGQLDCRE